MKVLGIEVWNFASYSHLRFEFGSLGLALIYGPTGSGKSTLMDITPWCLFGTTAKEGNVDEIRSWQAMEESTKGVARVQIGSGQIVTITRIRGNSKSNDLFFTNADGDHRGKDLQDTQKRIETMLGVSAKTYLLGSYFHEFSATGLFFTSKTKVQRSLLEGVAPLEFATDIGYKASEARKEAKRTVEEAKRQEDVLEARIEALNASIEDTTKRLSAWDQDHSNKVNNYTDKFNNFEVAKAFRVQKLGEKSKQWALDIETEAFDLASSLSKQEQNLLDPSVIESEIKTLTEEARCPSCRALSPRTSAELAKLSEKKAINSYNLKALNTDRKRLQSLIDSSNPYDQEIFSAKKEINGWESIVDACRKETNPFQAQLEKIEEDYKNADVAHSLQILATSKAETKVCRLSTIYDLSFELRGYLLIQSIQDIQNSTNRYMHDYFDAEIRIELAIEDSDSLEVKIQKSGYDCVYTQLSKGQRQILKLCFGVSIMKASANAAGVHFDTMMFDESLDGFDPGMKVKAFRLFEQLSTEHQNILVIDHSIELQDLFTTKFQVSMSGDSSEMERSSA